MKENKNLSNQNVVLRVMERQAKRRKLLVSVFLIGCITGVILTSIVVIILASIFSNNHQEQLSEEVLDKPVVIQLAIKTAAEEVNIIDSIEVVDETPYYISYIESKGVEKERATLIVESILNVGEEVPLSLIIAMIEKETDFRNIPAYDPNEDSMGYVQMQSSTIKWLKNLYPELPKINSQEEFQATPSAQMKYMAKYIEYATEKFDNNFTWVVSSYNMGVNNDKINKSYVDEVLSHKINLETYVASEQDIK